MARDGFGGFWIRVLASSIDSLITVMLFVAALAKFRLIGLLVAFGLLLLYGPVMESSPCQATVGKLLCRLAVIDKNGRRISFRRAVGRRLAKILSGITFSFGYLLVAIDGQKRGLHDLIAGTFVIRR
jgi:uncharacterized RDD family membrane protein YckC